MGENDFNHILEKVPTDVLLKAARDRNTQLREKYGPYGAQKKMSKCTKCGLELSAREMRKHKC